MPGQNESLSSLNLASEYSHVLEFAERYDARLRRRLHIEQSSSVANLACQARLSFIIEGQSSKVSPRELKLMLTSSSRDALNFADTSAEAELECRHSIIVVVN